MSVSMYSVYIADDEMWVIVGLKKRIEKTGLPFQVIGEANNGVMALEEKARYFIYRYPYAWL